MKKGIIFLITFLMVLTLFSTIDLVPSTSATSPLTNLETHANVSLSTSYAQVQSGTSNSYHLKVNQQI